MQNEKHHIAAGAGYMIGSLFGLEGEETEAVSAALAVGSGS